MKTLKKLMALTLAFVMAMALAIPSFAVEGERAGVDYDAPLRVTHLQKGDIAHFYQVIKWVGEEAGNVQGWKAVSPFDSILNSDGLAALLSDGDMNSDLAGQLARAASDEGTTYTVLSDGNAIMNNAEPGMWMVLINPIDADTVYNPVFISGDYQEVNSGAGYDYSIDNSFKDSVAKKSELTLTKDGVDSSGSVDTNDKDTVAVGDEMSFTVNTTIPGYGSIYVNPVFELTDKLNGLTLNKTSVKVTTHSDGDYTVDARDDGYTITFKPSYLKTVTTPTDVTVTYTATVNSDADYAINQKDNEVTLKYSHNPNDENDYSIKKDTTQHYTFSLDAAGLGSDAAWKGKKTSELVKTEDGTVKETLKSEITSSAEWTNPLADAEFALSLNSDGSNVVATATTGADGRMNFAGLDAGVYYLKETKAPTGYVKSTATVKVELIAETEDVTVTEYINPTTGATYSVPTAGADAVTYTTTILKGYTVKINDAVKDQYVFNNSKTPNDNDIQWEQITTAVESPFPIVNTKGTELPSTGGIGTKIFYALGAVLVIGAGVVLVSRKRALD